MGLILEWWYWRLEEVGKLATPYEAFCPFLILPRLFSDSQVDYATTVCMCGINIFFISHQAEVSSSAHIHTHTVEKVSSDSSTCLLWNMFWSFCLIYEISSWNMRRLKLKRKKARKNRKEKVHIIRKSRLYSVFSYLKNLFFQNFVFVFASHFFLLPMNLNDFGPTYSLSLGLLPFDNKQMWCR